MIKLLFRTSIAISDSRGELPDPPLDLRVELVVDHGVQAAPILALDALAQHPGRYVSKLSLVRRAIRLTTDHLPSSFTIRVLPLSPLHGPCPGSAKNRSISSLVGVCVKPPALRNCEPVHMFALKYFDKVKADCRWSPGQLVPVPVFSALDVHQRGAEICRQQQQFRLSQVLWPVLKLAYKHTVPIKSIGLSENLLHRCPRNFNLPFLYCCA